MADDKLTLKQIGEVVEQVVQPVVVRLNRIETDVKEVKQRLGGVEEELTSTKNKLSGVEGELKDVKVSLTGVEERMESQGELLQEIKIDLDVIKDDYIGQVEEIRSHLGMPPIIKHKAA